VFSCPAPTVQDECASGPVTSREEKAVPSLLRPEISWDPGDGVFSLLDSVMDNHVLKLVFASKAGNREHVLTFLRQLQPGQV
jgi:hypothetical protein